MIALVDGEHHPAAVRDALDRLERERGLAGVVFCGGEEKLRPGPARRATTGERSRPTAMRACAGCAPSAGAVVDLADEPVLAPRRAAAPGGARPPPRRSPTRRRACAWSPPAYARVDFAGPKLAVIGSGKRTGKTAVAGHWARLLSERGTEPVLVCMGRGGPAEPESAAAGIGARRAARAVRRRGATRPPTGWRERRSPACGRSAAGGWAAASRARPRSRTWRPGRRSRPRWDRTR